MPEPTGPQRTAGTDPNEADARDGFSLSRKEQGEVILSEVERLARLFQNTLDMARIDAAALSAEQRWVHLSELFEAARDQVGHTLKGVPLQVDIQPDLVVRLDPRLTAAALAHVLENAVHYSAHGSPVRVQLSVVANELIARVEDNGPGISGEDLAHLFERFYRGAAAARRSAGTGMGLAIARGFLAAQNGRIWAENLPERGARFTIAVPVPQRAFGEVA